MSLMIVLNLRLTFFPYFEHLMVLSPMPLHESVLNAVMGHLSYVFETIPVSSKVHLDVKCNSSVSKELIEGTPDGIVDMWSKHDEELRRLWLMESVFSQSDKDVMDKLCDYACNAPDLLVVCKIILKEAKHYCSPGLKWSSAKQLRSTALMSQREWRCRVVNRFALVIVDDYTWLSLLSVELHVWIRQPGKSKIDLNRSNGNGYAVGVSRLTPYTV